MVPIAFSIFPAVVPPSVLNYQPTSSALWRCLKTDCRSSVSCDSESDYFVSSDESEDANEEVIEEMTSDVKAILMNKQKGLWSILPTRIFEFDIQRKGWQEGAGETSKQRSNQMEDLFWRLSGRATRVPSPKYLSKLQVCIYASPWMNRRRVLVRIAYKLVDPNDFY